ncbi:hypothetical protein [Bradyrhizobium roseum]|uniref:hypothetical protein n=1 Tax=Bradyrhizobium roseum TaxID=3056648 RepID=UPI00261E4C3C|nr:hypothetical protein [Bradyrhizobium roseus]WKA31713.1 hypothetical protein QUH67_16815 [Bradyrhizobium roseus]
MSRHWTLLPLILFLGSTGTLQAQALDSPDVVYIDGQPCSRACQAYMDWSYRAQSARRHEERALIVAVPPQAEFERVEPVARPRAAKHAAPVARSAPSAGKTASNGNLSGAQTSNSKKIAAPNAARPAPNAMPPAMAAAMPAKPPEGTTASIEKPEPKVESANPPATLEVAAAPAAPPPATAANKAREIAKAATAPLDDPDNLVALVLAGPDISSLSDLNNKNIAITEKQSASSGRVSAALMAAGAAEVQFSEAKASAIDRLINGEVPAAVVLAPREVANLFPEVDGFRTFRLPLKARM